MAIHNSNFCSLCESMCAGFHSDALNEPLGGSGATIPEGSGDTRHTAWSITMCMAQCYLHVPIAQTDKERVLDAVKDVGFTDVDAPDESLSGPTKKCFFGSGNQNQRCRDLVRSIQPQYAPYVIGDVMGFYIAYHRQLDGWNADGTKQYGRIANETVECTGSCRYYQDTIGYAPKPNPRTYPEINNDTGYECTGFCRNWQQLQEGNGQGSLWGQEFLVPHIGRNGHYYLEQPDGSYLETPNIDLRAESLDVVAELAATAADEMRKEYIAFFDNKMLVREAIEEALRSAIPGMNFQMFILFTIGYSVGENDGLLKTWREKVWHDLVRPTTVIKDWGSESLTTYGGDPDVMEAVEIQARDFEAFIPMLSYAEYPSATSCLCTVYKDVTAAFADTYYSTTIPTIKINGNDVDYDEFFEICKNTRIWGGMNYPNSVEDGSTLCDSISSQVITYWTSLTAGMLAHPYVSGDMRPEC